MAEIVGTSYIPRTVTGLHSFDRAFHKDKVGFPAFGIQEIYGRPHVGKSTFCYSIAALLGKIWDCNISLADLEGLDQEFLLDVLNSFEFANQMLLVQEPSDEEMMEKMIDLFQEEVRIGILDSIGAISPIQEVEGDVGDANMGRRARIVAQLSRKFTHQIIGKNDKLFLMTNHQHPILGGMGTSTPGGKTIEYLSGVRIYLKQKKGYPDNSDTSQGYLLEGTIAKNRYGGKGAKFHVFVVSGMGIHLGMTAVFDCIDLGLTDGDRTIKIGDQSFGYVKNIIAKAQEGDKEFFTPFHELLEKGKSND